MQTLDEYYPRVSLTALVKLLRTSHEVKYAVKATQHICEHFDANLLSKYLEYVLYGYMDAIRRQDLDTEEDDHKIELFRCLADLVVMSRGGIRSHVGVLIKLLDEFWHTHLWACLDVMKALEETLSVAEFQMHAVELLNLLLRTIRSDRDHTREKTRAVLSTLLEMSGRDSAENVITVPNQLRLVLPDLMRIVELPANREMEPVRRDALRVVRSIVERTDQVVDFASVIVLPLLRVIRNSAHQGMKENSDAMLLNNRTNFHPDGTPKQQFDRGSMMPMDHQMGGSVVAGTGASSCDP